MAKQHMRDFKVLATPLWHQEKDWCRDFAPLQHLPECSFCLRDVITSEVDAVKLFVRGTHLKPVLSFIGEASMP
jgi:hypothetical protein